MINEAIYSDPQKIPDGVIIGMLESEIQELQDTKAKLEVQYDELKRAYDSVMSLDDAGKKKVREAMYGDFFAGQLKALNDTLIEKNKRLQSTNDELMYKLTRYQLKERQNENK